MLLEMLAVQYLDESTPYQPKETIIGGELQRRVELHETVNSKPRTRITRGQNVKKKRLYVLHCGGLPQCEDRSY